MWVKDHKLREAVADYMNGLHLSCKECNHPVQIQVSADGITSILRGRTMYIKVNSMKEKFIAIENKKKRNSSTSDNLAPDYLIHLYQTHTGATPSYPFKPQEKRP